MEKPTLISGISTFDNLYRHRRLSAPAKLQTFNTEEPKLLGNSVIDGDLRLLCGDNRSIITNRNRATIHHHYYPEGDWGWIVTLSVATVHAITAGTQCAFGLVIKYFYHPQEDLSLIKSVIIGALSTAVTLFLSPLVIAICRRKSIRLIAILGGLVTALGCLFTSFATQFHQLFVSYGVIGAIGVSMTRDTAVIMIGQYFKKRREFVEIFVIGATGLGIAFMPLFLTFCIRSKNWRFGFQSLALITFITFFLAVLYRPASLYHPQRRAILHLKSLQKRSRLKEHFHTTTQKQNSTASSQVGTIEKPPYFDFSVLKSRTIQILICGTCISAFGTATPLLLMVQQGAVENIESSSLMTLQAFMGIGMVLGTCAIGTIIVQNSVECMIARQYLCQASCFMLSATLLAFTALDDYSGYMLFVWIYGFFYGGYQYSLKMFIYEKVRARNFNRAWGYVQCSQSIPIMVGVPISAFLNEHFGDRVGYYLSSACIALGSAVLFFIDAHKKRIAKKRKIISVSGTELVTDTQRCSQDPSLKMVPYVHSLRGSNDPLGGINRVNGTSQLHDNSNYSSLATNHLELIRNTRARSNSIFSSTIGGPINAELTCISEEIVLDNFLDDSINESMLNECITSSNKEKYLMYSEFENNLNNVSEEAANIIKRRKEEVSSQDRAIIQFHEANCPMAKVIADNKTLSSNPLQESSSAAKQRRASFAGIASSVSSGVLPLEQQTTAHIEQCPNCGDELMGASNILNDHITEEDEVDEDSIDSCQNAEQSSKLSLKQ